MIDWVTGLLAILLGVLLIPVLVLFTQSMLALLPARPAAAPTGRRPRSAILIPAHNEAGGIAATLATVLPQLQDGDRVLVIADNCSDQTAAIARAAGAEVCERQHLTERGKGYALDFGMRQLRADPPEVVMIVDADCLLGAGAIDRLARQTLARGRPQQALYLMHAPAGSGVLKKVAEFAWVVKNQVRPLGFLRLGLPCQLMGTGMAFPWALISAAPLANGHIVEDMKLGMDLARAGHAPQFCPEVCVTSSFPTSNSGTDSQRTRWEHGHLSMIGAVPRLLLGAVGHADRGMLGLALDLCVPPLALLCLLMLAATALTLLFALLSGAVLPLALAALGLLLTGAAVLAAWWRHGRHLLRARDLATALLYMLRKIPLYLRFVINRQVEWVRSKRDTEK
ncbi:cellulose synthase/poly-beta-1,6-N-acetylglucosamine synthase-like glycosyltransferase [Duganella sp. 1224]|uniref:glycosyltransferase family 2 protein n=1 Tax=Duganella sp. 1224 TaxID=2587052 RepID=UPI0015C8A291|nr:glycosyltransferase family 2 protein [Duganella sp. 1224]NYE62149.1 cellulose synthase/poly-beta-1,6-N-acetylglucosamine synthase-like glycosyltransferase [Duganella sp. 1224]